MSVKENQAYNLAENFVDRHVAEGRGERPAIRCERRIWTYRELLERINRAGNLFKSLGVQEEQRVLIVLPDSPDFVVSYFAAIKIGAVAVPTNTALSPEEYRTCLDDSRARVLVVSSDLLPRISPVLQDRPYLKHVIVVGREQGVGV